MARRRVRDARRFILAFLGIYFALHIVSLFSTFGIEQTFYPSSVNQPIFDEAYYVPASLQTLQGVGLNAEHPPLPKLIGAAGIALLGSNWFGWRFPVVVMQVIAMYLFYLVGRRFVGEWWSLGATILLGLDTVWFIHGGTLLIDMPMFLFGFLSLELYFRGRYYLSAVVMALAFLSRELAVFLFAALMIYHVYARRGRLGQALGLSVKYTVVAFLVFLALLGAYDLSFHPVISSTRTDFVSPTTVVVNGVLTTTYVTQSNQTQAFISNPLEHLLFIYRFYGPGGFEFPSNQTYAAYRYPWNWVLPFDLVQQNGSFVTPNPLSSPAYLRLNLKARLSNGTTTVVSTPVFYRAQANLPVWYGIWPAIAASLFAIKRKRNWQTGIFVLSGILLNYLPWMILFRRIGYNFYFIYALPFVALGLALAWKSLPPGYAKPVMVANILAALGFFIWFFPVKVF